MTMKRAVRRLALLACMHVHTAHARESTELRVVLGSAEEFLTQPELSIDGGAWKSLQHADGPIGIVPGVHALRIRALGFEAYELSLRAAPNQTHVVFVPQLRKASMTLNRNGKLGAVMVATGGLALAGALVFSGLAVGASNTADGRCSPQRACTTSGLSDIARAGSFADAATGLALGGGVVLLTGVLLFLTGRSPDRSMDALVHGAAF
jgi:hypothetical protein